MIGWAFAELTGSLRVGKNCTNFADTRQLAGS